MTKEIAGKRVIKKVGSCHVIWFPESNRWIGLKEPAWFIYRRYEKGDNQKCITGHLTKRYGLPADEARRFYREIISGLKLSSRQSGSSFSGAHQDPVNTTGESAPLPQNDFPGKTPLSPDVPAAGKAPSLAEHPETTGFVARHYLINNKHITISYGSPLLEYYLHRPLAHLERGAESGETLHIRLSQKRAGTGAGSGTGNNAGENVVNRPVQETREQAKTGADISGGPKAESRQKADSRQEADSTKGAGSSQGVMAKNNSFYLQVEKNGRKDSRQYCFYDAGEVKHRVYIQICCHIYGVPENEWMSYIHASALTNGREAVLLSSASGSGKSTMAALLQLPAESVFATTEKENGEGKYAAGDDADRENRCRKAGRSDRAGRYPGADKGDVPDPGSGREGRYLIYPGAYKGADREDAPGAGDLFFMSDDFVPVAAGNKKAHPFPAAITIKKGSFDVISPYYDPAGDADTMYRGMTNRQVRYLCPRFPERDPFTPQPVKKIIFIRHNPEITFKLEKLSTIKALAAFHEEAWVSQNPGHAQNFIDWFVTLSCYRLEYSDNQKAVKAINNLFNKS